MHEYHDHPHATGLPARGALYHELVHHLPFSVSAVALGLTFAGVICFLTPAGQRYGTDGEAVGHVCEAHPAAHDEDASESGSAHGPDAADAHHDHEHDAGSPFFVLFHLFHPLHMLFSAAATTAMFWRYERRVIKAIIVGLIGAVGVCGLSDIVMPQLSLMMLGMSLPWHICLIRHPHMVLSFAFVGVLVGLAAAEGVRQSTFFSHSLHVFASSMASIFYMIRPFDRLGWFDSVGTIFLFVIIAVMVPCCFSDIVFPLLLAGRNRQQYRSEHTGCCS